MRALAAGIALCACAGASGCATAALGAAAGAGLVLAQERTFGEAINDAAGAAEVKTRLLALDRQGFAEIDVELAGGRLLLSGPAPSLQHRIEAERIAWSVPSVREVANEIRMGPRTGVLRSALDEMTTAQVRARMLASGSVRSVDVNIETNDGVVYLLGLARSQTDIENAARVASYTPGVQRVVSYMVVREPPRALTPPSQAAMDASSPSVLPPFPSAAPVADQAAPLAPYAVPSPAVPAAPALAQAPPPRGPTPLY